MIRKMKILIFIETDVVVRHFIFSKAFHYLNEAHASENLPTKKFTEQGVKHYLEWYARLGLGEQILDCVKEKGECQFEAEL